LKIVLSFALILFSFCLYAQNRPVSPESEQFYYSPKGMSYVPSLTKPGLIYQGQLYSGKRSLDYLMENVKVPECYLEYIYYKRNRTAASILSLVGSATSIIGLIGTNDNRNINWYLLGGGMLINGSSAYLNAAASQHLRAIAVILDQQKIELEWSILPNNWDLPFQLIKEYEWDNYIG